MKEETFPKNDHDLLIEIHTKMNRVIEDVRVLNDTTVVRLAKVELEKASIIQIEELQAQISSLQKIVYTGLGALAVIEFYFMYVRK